MFIFPIKITGFRDPLQNISLTLRIMNIRVVINSTYLFSSRSKAYVHIKVFLFETPIILYKIAIK